MKAVGTSRPPSPRMGVQVVGGQRVKFYCILRSNKQLLVPSLLAQHLHITARTTCLLVIQGPEMGGRMEYREQGFPGRGLPLSLWGWGFSLIFKAPYCVNTAPIIQGMQ